MAERNQETAQSPIAGTSSVTNKKNNESGALAQSSNSAGLPPKVQHLIPLQLKMPILLVMMKCKGLTYTLE